MFEALGSDLAKILQDGMNGIGPATRTCDGALQNTYKVWLNLDYAWFYFGINAGTKPFQLRWAQGDPRRALGFLDEAERLFIRTPMPDLRPVAAIRARIWA